MPVRRKALLNQVWQICQFFLRAKQQETAVMQIECRHMRLDLMQPHTHLM